MKDLYKTYNVKGNADQAEKTLEYELFPVIVIPPYKSTKKPAGVKVKFQPFLDPSSTFLFHRKHKTENFLAGLCLKAFEAAKPFNLKPFEKIDLIKGVQKGDQRLTAIRSESWLFNFETGLDTDVSPDKIRELELGLGSETPFERFVLLNQEQWDNFNSTWRNTNFKRIRYKLLWKKVRTWIYGRKAPNYSQPIRSTLHFASLHFASLHFASLILGREICQSPKPQADNKRVAVVCA
jgi:hypothetical protein